MSNLLIFSKDRPPQLNLLLDSIETNCKQLFPKIKVLYKASDSKFKKGYNKCISLFDNIEFVEEKNFYKDTLDLLNTEEKLSIFMTDDDIVYRQTSILEEDIEDLFYNHGVASFSMRLGSNTYIQNYHTGEYTIFPESYNLYKHFILWNWIEVPLHMNFGYICSVDGHWFMTSELLEMVKNMKDAKQPNDFECKLINERNILPTAMACLQYSILVNTPNNRVQEFCKNKAGERYGASQEELNKIYLAGHKLSLDLLDTTNICGCHQELKLRFQS